MGQRCACCGGPVTASGRSSAPCVEHWDAQMVLGASVLLLAFVIGICTILGERGVLSRPRIKPRDRSIMERLLRRSVFSARSLGRVAFVRDGQPASRFENLYREAWRTRGTA